MRRSLAIGIALVLAAGGAALARAGTSSPGSGGGVDPSNFVRHVTNPYFPLKPGTVLVYRGIKDGQTQVDRVTVTHDTRKIEGVTTTTIRDVATHGRHVLESTTDWYAQDKQGNVWYFGEATKSYAGGHGDTSGAWLAGGDNPRPAALLEAGPKDDTAHQQEAY